MHVYLLTLIALAIVVVSVPRRGLIRQFNKHILNPLALWVLGRRPTYYAALEHVGRTTGRTYTTPVVAKLTAEGVLIPLPYGANTDWCRNVLAAGSCSLVLNGIPYELVNPRVVDARIGEALVPPANAWVWRRFGVRQYLQLAVREAGATEGLAA